MEKKLTVKQEHLHKAISYGSNGGTYQVELAKASQDQLKVLYELGKKPGNESLLDIFEPEAKEKK